MVVVVLHLRVRWRAIELDAFARRIAAPSTPPPSVAAVLCMPLLVAAAAAPTLPLLLVLALFSHIPALREGGLQRLREQPASVAAGKAWPPPPPSKLGSERAVKRYPRLAPVENLSLRRDFAFFF